MRVPSMSLLRLADFRRLATSTALNSIGMMGETVVLGWLALEMTNSPFLVGVAMGARSIPGFFVGIPAGVLADRFPRHRLLIATAAGQALMTAMLGVLTVSGLVSFGAVLLFTLGAGTIRAVEHAARQGLAHDVVGAGELMNGLAVLGVAMRGGWLLGSLSTGAVIAWFGSGIAYVTVAVAYLAGAAALWAMSTPSGARPAAGGSVWRDVNDFVAATRRDRTLLVLMMLTAAAEVLGFAHQAVLPSLARDVLRVGPEGLGTMNAARSIGGVLGLWGLLALRLTSTPAGGGALLITVLLSFGASVLVLGLAPHVVGFAGVVVVLIIANAAGALTDLLAQGLIQLSVPAALRGRAGGAWVVAIGLAPLGQLQIGALASLFGVGIALGASGLALVALAGITALVFPRVRHL